MAEFQRGVTSDEVKEKVEGGLQALGETALDAPENIQYGIEALGETVIIGWYHLQYNFWSALGQKSKSPAQQEEEAELGDTLPVSDLNAPSIQQ